MRHWRIQENGLIPHFVTWRLVEWAPVFVSERYCGVITDSLAHCRRERGLLVHGYVVMPTHVHGVLSVREGGDLAAVLRDSRKYTAREIVLRLKQDNNRLMERVLRYAAEKAGRPAGEHQVWADDTHPEAIVSKEFARQKLDYLHNNPVRKGLVAAPEHWRYSSAAFYAGEVDCPLEIDVLEL